MRKSRIMFGFVKKTGSKDWSSCFIYGSIISSEVMILTLHWRHNGCNGVSNHQTHDYDCLLNRLFRRRSKKTSKLRVTGLCAGNSPVTGEFPAQMASSTENNSNWWRHHDFGMLTTIWMCRPLADYKFNRGNYQKSQWCVELTCINNRLNGSS